jgi:hypothetical protein
MSGAAHGCARTSSPRADRLTDEERRQFAVGPRFSTGLCLSLVVALARGGLLVAACGVVTATNLCLPSEMFAWLERRHTPSKPTTT